ncbi:histidine triad nucleotide-binding protein 3 [Drosophila grimshawi]|uniref:histidine triad nucleotide-binding protein 3 n=1 Tax=Drosophila grimshawi TaxID=7222 RepID=UPI000C8707F2|nr:histidine triad nucleotide-binding protein 3 [Drosophila grimshawi]
MADQNCLFCDIVSGKTKTVLEVDTNEFTIFKDIRPAAEHHYLIVTKQHYDSLKVLNESHEKMILAMEEGLKSFFVSKGISTTDALYGFHFPPFISVKHLHMHGIAPRSEMNIISRMVFRPATAWFKTTSEAIAYLKKKLN